MTAEYDAYVELLNSNPENNSEFETVLIRHSKFSKTHYYVFDSVTLNAALQSGVYVDFLPANARTTNAENSNDLDQAATFTLGDLENNLDDELDRIPLGDTEDIIIGYGIYTTGNLDRPAAYVEYIVDSIPQKEGAFSIRCGAPKLNIDETGEIFDYDRFPMLRYI